MKVIRIIGVVVRLDVEGARVWHPYVD